MTTGATRASVRARPGTFEVTDDRVFAPGGEALARRFAQRVLAFAEAQSLALDPAAATAILKYRSDGCDPGIFLSRLAGAIAAPASGVTEIALPYWTAGEPVTLYRHSSVISIFAELDIQNGHLRARDPTLESNQAIARRVENALRVVPGVINAAATRHLYVRFDPRAVSPLQLVRIAEAEIFSRPSEAAVSTSQPVNFDLENIMVGVSAVGEFVLPLIAPVAS